MATFNYDSSDADQKLIVTRVLQYVDRVTEAGQTIGPDEDRVYEYAVEGMRSVLTLSVASPALRERLYSIAKDGSTQTTNVPVTTSKADEEAQYVEVVCPEDYIDFIRVRLEGSTASDDWRRAVEGVGDRRIPAGSRQHRLLHNVHSTATTMNPAVVVASNTNYPSQTVLQCFPKPDVFPSDGLAEFDYLGEVRPENVPDLFLLPMYWFAASELLQSDREEVEIAAAAKTKGRNALRDRAVSLPGSAGMFATTDEDEE